ncbi:MULTISPECIES: 2'-5' RNA ligase family protein [Nocardia]|jgi:2'-5' RNA ligase|uniref:2'-5' RNA ligase family protein n=1 Tax=Nocardia TaxID=1817 RepID=UPI0015EF04E0|nr:MULTISPECIES: 2'-5' RNA ligase family protein [Nocardia]MBF6472678.1 2'-5' RNA ligase family protein [Nocardia abscessus]
MSKMSNADNKRNDRRVGPLGYYWFITFEHASDLHALTEECQQAIDATWFYPVSSDRLHLTLDRIAYDGESAREQLDSIVTAARRACQDQMPFTMTIEQPSNLRGAIGFKVSPAERVRNLRDVLRSATLSVLPEAPVKESISDPHVTIAYPAFARATDAVEINTAIHRADVSVMEAAMVSLERREFSYSWDVYARISLAG